MKAKLLLLITVVIAACSFTIAQLALPAYAADPDICDPNAKVADSVKDAAGCGKENDALPKIVIGIIYGIIGVSGLVAVVYVLIGGYNYMTSTGDPSKLEKAKKTILYACIGLAVCVLSFAIVNFVNNNIINYQSTSDTDDTTDSETTK